MGGRGGGGKKSSPPPQDNSSAMMMAMIQQQMAQQAAMFQEQQRLAREAEERAEKAQKEAALRAENVAAEEKMAQSYTGAQSALDVMESQQKLQDEQALANAQQQYAAAGTAATGGGYDINRSREEALKNLGATSGTLPQTAANRAALAAGAQTGVGAQSTNVGSGGTADRQNVFTLPAAKGLTFGGS